MSFKAIVPVAFPCKQQIVYEALSNLETMPLWNSGMIEISQSGVMTPGLKYETKVAVAGQVTTSEVEVITMLEPSEIVLKSNSGLVSYRAVFILKGSADDGTTVTCSLTFDFKNLMLDIARPAIQSMASSRIRGDLEILRALLTQTNKS